MDSEGMGMATHPQLRLMFLKCLEHGVLKRKLSHRFMTHTNQLLEGQHHAGGDNMSYEKGINLYIDAMKGSVCGDLYMSIKIIQLINSTMRKTGQSGTSPSKPAPLS